MHHIALVLFAALGLDRKNYGLAAFWALVTILAGWSVIFAASSWDYHGYIVYFQCATTALCFAPSFGGIEASLTLIARTIAAVVGTDGGPALVGFYSVFAVIIKLQVFRRETHAFGAALLAYLCFGFFVHEMTQVRVGFAIALLWLSLSAWATPQKKWFGLAWFALAVTIHTSAVLAAIVPVFARIRLSFSRVLILLVVAAIAGQLFETELRPLIGTIDIVVAGRIGAYLSDIGSDISRVPQFSIYASCTAGIILVSYVGQTFQNWTKFERMAQSSVVAGLALYFMVYWLAVIGQRAFELLTSPLPFVVAATWQHSRSSFIRVLLAVMLLAIFYNLMVRNGVMKDFVLDGTAQYMRIMQGAVN